jgi:hypothetical protein
MNLDTLQARILTDKPKAKPEGNPVPHTIFSGSSTPFGHAAGCAFPLVPQRRAKR